MKSWMKIGASLFGFLVVLEVASAVALTRYPMPRDLVQPVERPDEWTVGSEFRTVLAVPDDLFFTEPPVADPAECRVLFMGDSFTVGSGVSRRERFSSLLPARLGSEFSERPTRIANHGMRGADVHQEHAVFTQHSSWWSADVVVWTLILNDLLPTGDLATDLVTDDALMWNRTWSRTWDLGRLTVFRWWSSRAITRAYRAAATPGDRNFKGSMALLQEAVEHTTDRGGRFVLVLFPLLVTLSDYPFAEEHDHIIAVAEAAGAEVVDLRHAYVGQQERELWVTLADHHPNARGHVIAADALGDYLRPGGCPVSSAAVCEDDCELDPVNRWISAGQGLEMRAPAWLMAHQAALFAGSNHPRLGDIAAIKDRVATGLTTHPPKEPIKH